MIVILIVGGYLRFVSYDFRLPYIDYIDESFMLTSILSKRGLYAQPNSFLGYPPIILWTHTVAQHIVEATTHRSILEDPSASIRLVRFASATLGTLTILIVGLLGRKLGGDISGLMAAMAIAVLPEIIYWSSYALSEPWLILFYSLAFYWAVLALYDDQPIWTVLSVAAGLGAVCSKYSAYLMLLPGCVVVLWKIRTQPSKRNSWLRTLIAQLGLIFACTIWLFFVYGVLSITQLNSGNNEANTFLSSGLARALDLSLGTRLISILFSTHLGLNIWLSAVMFTGGLILSDKKPNGNRVMFWCLIGIGLISLATAWLVATFLWYGEGIEKRYLTPASIGMVVILSVVAVKIAEWIGKYLRAPLIKIIFSVVFATVWLLPHLAASWNLVYDRARPDTRTALAIWSAKNLDALGSEGIIVGPAGSQVFSREWGGYRGNYRVWWAAERLFDHPLSYWKGRYFSFAVLDEGEHTTLLQSEQGSVYRNNMLLLNQFPPPTQRDRWNGPTMFVYRLQPIQNQLDVTFGDQIRLLGYDLFASGSGASPEITLYWQAIRVPSDNYNVFMHLLPMGGALPTAQFDGAPADPDRPTLTWNITETMISRKLKVSIPDGTPVGSYRLVLGLYNYQSGRRLRTDSGEFVQLRALSISQNGVSYENR
jgi:4-amino-4-deoxy-L-arabinose transferase-like glycosyltransferase